MSRFLALLFTLLMVGCVSNAVLIPLTTERKVRQASDVTVALVFTPRVENPPTLPYCTGVWVSADVILTANHCIDGLARMINKEHEDDDTIPNVRAIDVRPTYIMESEVTGIKEMPAAVHQSYVLALDKDDDLALLKVVNPESVKGHAIAPLASEAPGVGSKLHVVGHMRGMYWTYSEAMVSGYRESLKKMGVKRGGPFMQVSGSIYFGNSGGGAFNEQGELVGICSFMFGPPTQSMFIHLETVRGFMASEKLVALKINPMAADPKL